MNVVALAGRLSRPPEERVLDSGTRLMSMQVTVPGVDGKGETVPVAWFDPAASAVGLDEGDPVVVVGRVRRRFFRAGATTQSRTEVVAETVVSGTRAGAVRKALTGAIDRLAAGLDAGPLGAPGATGRR